MKKQILVVILTLRCGLSLLQPQGLVAEGSEGASVASVVQDGFLGQRAPVVAGRRRGTLTRFCKPGATSYTDYDMPDILLQNQPWDNMLPDIRSIVIWRQVTRMVIMLFTLCTI